MMRLWIALAVVMATAGWAAPERGENLVVNGGFEETAAATSAGWGAVGSYSLAPGEGRGGGMAIRCDSDQVDSGTGAMQEVVFDPPIKHPFKVSGWSKAQAAAGEDYCLYMDCWYEDGTNLWGQRMHFADGTHDWQSIDFIFTPEKPIAKIQFFILFRRCTGTVWFDDVSLSLAPFEVQRERIAPSLYGGNSLDYSARLSLPGKWKAEVLREARPVFSVQGEGAGINFAWPGTDERGTLLPGGDYVVSITAKDDLLGEELLHEAPATTRSGPGNGYLAWTAGSMERVLINEVPAAASGRLRATVSLAGNEYEGFQVALRAAPGHELKDCTVAISDLRGPGGEVIPKANLAWQQVGFVQIKKLWNHPHLPEHAVPGWWPDPLLEVEEFTVNGGETQAVWFTLYAPPGTPAGRYTGRVTITPANAEPVTVRVAATVYPFDLPTQGHLKTAFALMDSYLEKLYGDAPTELRRKYGDYALRFRLNPDDISRTDPPEIEDIAYYNDRGLNAFNAINMVEPRTKGNWVCWSPLETYTPEFKADLIRRLDPWVAELKRRGLERKAYVYTYDERGKDFWPVMTEFFGLIKERYGLPTFTTAYIPQDVETMRSLNLDWNCPLTPAYRYEQAEAMRKAGMQDWVYVCCGPRYPYANWLAEDPLVESRVIWWSCFEQQVDGMLYWGLNIWHRENNDYLIDPEKDGPKLRWSITTGNGSGDWTDALSGDGDLLYAGKDGPIGCIRLANIRDGLEDYEYLWLLARKLGSVEAAREACAPVTTSFTQFTRDPKAVYRERDRIARRLAAR